MAIQKRNGKGKGKGAMAETASVTRTALVTRAASTVKAASVIETRSSRPNGNGSGSVKLPPDFPPIGVDPPLGAYRYMLRLQNGITRGFFYDLFKGREALNNTPNGKALIRICDGAVISVKQKAEEGYEYLERLFRRRDRD
jgi:hypothetical protein